MREGCGFKGFLVLLCTAAVLCCLFFSNSSAYAQSSEKELTERTERLEKVIQDYKQMMQHYEEELNALKGELKKHAETVDQKVDAAVQTPEHLEYFRHTMESVRLTEAGETPEEQRVKTLYDVGFYLKGVVDQLWVGDWLQMDTRWFLNGDDPSDHTLRSGGAGGHTREVEKKIRDHQADKGKCFRGSRIGCRPSPTPA